MGRKNIKGKGVLKQKKECESSLANFITNLEKGTAVINDQSNVKDFLDYWLEVYPKKQCQPTTYKRYKEFSKHIIEYLGKYKLTKLNVLIVQKFYNDLSEKEGLSNNTIIKVHRMLHLALRHAQKWQMVAVNVCDIVDPPKSTPIKIKYWNADEVPFYLQKLKSTELYPLIFVAVSTGLREGELLALQWDDIDMINGTVKINKTLSRLNGKLVLKEPKTENSKREVVLLDSTIIFLKTLKKKAMEQKLEHGIDLNYVFRKKDGSIYRPEFISKRFRQLCSENNIPSIRFHDLRHTHATMMLKLGVNEKVISERLGHSRVSFTLDTYTHVDTTMQRDEIQKLNRIL